MEHSTALVIIVAVCVFCVTAIIVATIMFPEKKPAEESHLEGAIVAMTDTMADTQAVLVNALVTPLDDQIARIEAENTDDKRRPIARGKTRFTPPSGYLPDMMGDPEDIPRE